MKKLLLLITLMLSGVAQAATRQVTDPELGYINYALHSDAQLQEFTKWLQTQNLQYAQSFVTAYEVTNQGQFSLFYKIMSSSAPAQRKYDLLSWFVYYGLYVSDATLNWYLQSRPTEAFNFLYIFTQYQKYASNAYFGAYIIKSVYLSPDLKIQLLEQCFQKGLLVTYTLDYTTKMGDTQNGVSLLYVAADLGKEEVFHFLIKKGAYLSQEMHTFAHNNGIRNLPALTTTPIPAMAASVKRDKGTKPPAYSPSATSASSATPPPAGSTPAPAPAPKPTPEPGPKGPTPESSITKTKIAIGSVLGLCVVGGLYKAYKVWTAKQQAEKRKADKKEELKKENKDANQTSAVVEKSTVVK